jgi:hypothetical protein
LGGDLSAFWNEGSDFVVSVDDLGVRRHLVEVFGPSLGPEGTYVAEHLGWAVWDSSFDLFASDEDDFELFDSKEDAATLLEHEERKPDAVGYAYGEHGIECPHEHQLYMVYDRVWQIEAGLNVNDVMCIDCLQKRIGRTLAPEDFYCGCPASV